MDDSSNTPPDGGIPYPQLRWDQVREPCKRLSMMLTVHALTWPTFVQLDDRVRAILLAEAEIFAEGDFRDACDQLTQIVQHRNAVMMARAKPVGEAGAH